MSENLEQIIKEIRDTGAGKTVSEELLNMFTVKRSEDLMIPTRSGETHIFIHYPESEKEILPVFVNIHGGGFVKGHRQQDIVFSKNICQRAECIVVDIDYVPAPEQKYPYAINQCYDTAKWVYNNAGELNADKDKIVLCGHSAGGSCVVAVALMANETKEFPIAMQILDYPCLDVHTPPELKENAYKNPSLQPSRMRLYNDLYIDENQVLEPTASVVFAPDEMLIGLPETMIFSCGNDALRDEAEKYAYRLIQNGVPVMARRFINSSHGFVVRRKDEFEEAENMILSALKRVFDK